MRQVFRSTLAVAALMAVPAMVAAQGAPAAGAPAAGGAPMDASRTVTDGGIKIPGWTGRIDFNEVAAGATLNSARLATDGDALAVTTGPAVTYWNPTNVATGNYTVSATFVEPKYQNLNNHPHPYGIMIGGNDLDTDTHSYLYCAAYGNGNFIVRGFGAAAGAARSTVFQMNGGRGAAHAAVNRAPAVGQPVTQKIAIEVKADVVECSINDTVVASYPKADLIAAGRLKSTDGIYGIRFAHNTEAIVTALTMTKR